MRPIDADNLPVTTLIDGVYWTSVDIVYKRDIDNLELVPTLDVMPLQHGKWIRTMCGDDFVENLYPECSLCGKGAFYVSDFCPHCGARMDLQQ